MLTMAGRNVKRLYDLEIDEVSLVDRSANQHADVAIAKRDEDNTMTVIDERGNEVDLEALQPGDVVFDSETGEPLVACEEGQEPEDYFDLSEEDANELAEVGKALVSKASPLQSKTLARGIKAMDFAGRHKTALAATGAGAAGYTGGRMSKSLGEEVYETLSKALGEDARNDVISKALQEADERVAKAERAAELALGAVEQLSGQLEHERYTNIAKSYGVPGEPEELAEILKSLDPRQAAYMDRVLSSVGEQLFDAYGADLGGQDATIQGQIEAMAQEAVGKSNVSFEEATTALYGANPDAYDQYLAENR